MENLCSYVESSHWGRKNALPSLHGTKTAIFGHASAASKQTGLDERRFILGLAVTKVA